MTIDRYSTIDWNELFQYDPTSKSCLRWKIDFGFNGIVFNNKKGSEVGFANNGGSTPETGNYYKINVLKNRYYVHRIIWYMFNDTIPHGFVVNHIDCNLWNNTIDNLEICSEADNARRRKEHKTGVCNKASKTGVTGVVFRETKSGGRWVAHWSYDKKIKTKSFSVLKYGYAEARGMAIKARNKAIALLVQKGYGYRL